MQIGRRAALIGLGLTSFAARAQAQDNKLIKIGAIGSVTGPGAPINKDFFDGFNAYISDWNRRGAPEGRKVVMQSYDDQSTPVGAISAYRRLIEEPNIGVIWSAMNSSQGLGVKPLSTAPGIPIITPGAVDALAVPPAPYFFKTPPATRDWISTLLSWAKAHAITSIATIQATDAYGQTITEAVKELGPSYGVRVLASEVFATTDTNFTAQLINVRNVRPELVYTGGFGTPGILLFQQLRQLQLSMQVMLDQIVISKAFLAAESQAAIEGVLTVVQLGALGEQVGGEGAKMYRQLSAVLGRPATIFNTVGWDTGTITEAAIKAAGLLPKDIRNGIEGLHNLPTINGPVSFSPTNHTGTDQRALRVAKFVSGRLVLA
jgi:branched-chain amino acid transport system substrate-binding protein